MSIKAKRCWGWIAIAVPILALVTIPLWQPLVITIANYLPPCLFYYLFQVACPGCGNTRSVVALSRGEILLSLRYNISPIVLGVIALLLYIELISWLLGHHKKILTRYPNFPVVMVLIMVVYFVVRNLIPALQL